MTPNAGNREPRGRRPVAAAGDASRVVPAGRAAARAAILL